MAELAGETRFLLERLARMIRANEHAGELNPAQWETLRYLARANKFSDSPLAVTRYLNATKGTVSQTIIALERKGYVTRAPRENERRSIRVKLTDAGYKLLKDDPWTAFDNALAKLKPKQAKVLAKSMRDMVAREVKTGNIHGFGHCNTCRYFRERGAESKDAGPHQCLLLEVPLKKKDTKKICIEHQAL